MKKVKFVLGWLWALPLSIFGYLLVLFLIISKQVEAFFWDDSLALIIDLKNNGWFQKKKFEERGWIGFSCGACVFVKDVHSRRWGRTIKHELRHCVQQYILGVLFPIIYMCDSILIYFLFKDQHSYYDNWFEKDARRYAGQLINIPKRLWANGPNDRWAWW